MIIIMQPNIQFLVLMNKNTIYYKINKPNINFECTTCTNKMNAFYSHDRVISVFSKLHYY